MSYYLIEQIRAAANIDVRLCTEVVGVEGEDHLQRVRLSHNLTGEAETLECGHLFVFIGAAPYTDWLPDGLQRDGQGFVVTGPDLLSEGARPAGWSRDRDPFLLETSIPGVFAAGDVRSASVKRVASAVGEGAMAVTLVHQFLERA
jgi:thioredoxin reductase (NADPH)